MMGVGPDGIDLPLIHDAPIRLAITASGSGTWQRVLDPVEQHVRAVLEPTATVNVRVTGDLVPGDEIAASLHSLPPPAANATFVAGGQARAEGPRVTITLGDHIGPGAYVIEVSSPRHRSTRVAGVLVRFPGEVVEVEARLEALRDLGSLRLTFRENGAALAALPVDAGLMLLLKRAGDPTGAWRFAWARRSPAGEVVLSNLPAGTYDLLCSLRKPARAVLVRGVVVRADESSAVVAVVEPPLWARVPSGAETAPDAEILARDGQSLPRFFDEGGRMQVDEPGTASSPATAWVPSPSPRVRFGGARRRTDDPARSISPRCRVEPQLVGCARYLRTVTCPR